MQTRKSTTTARNTQKKEKKGTKPALLDRKNSTPPDRTSALARDAGKHLQQVTKSERRQK